jgi:hypothetical protein
MENDTQTVMEEKTTREAGPDPSVAPTTREAGPDPSVARSGETRNDLCRQYLKENWLEFFRLALEKWPKNWSEKWGEDKREAFLAQFAAMTEAVPRDTERLEREMKPLLSPLSEEEDGYQGEDARLLALCFFIDTFMHVWDDGENPFRQQEWLDARHCEEGEEECFSDAFVQRTNGAHAVNTATNSEEEEDDDASFHADSDTPPSSSSSSEESDDEEEEECARLAFVMDVLARDDYVAAMDKLLDEADLKRLDHPRKLTNPLLALGKRLLAENVAYLVDGTLPVPKLSPTAAKKRKAEGETEEARKTATKKKKSATLEEEAV